jgi:hypothetical protein
MSAPDSSGRWKYGVANVLSTTSSAPCRGARSRRGREVGERMSGFVGVSTSTHARRRRHRVGDALRVARVDVAEASPKCWSSLSNRRKVPPYTFSPQTTWSPARNSFMIESRQPHAAREREAVAAALERGYVPLERLARGVLAARVLVALVLAERVLHVGRREVHGRHDRAGERLGALARVDGAGAEARREIVVEDARHAASGWVGGR